MSIELTDLQMSLMRVLWTRGEAAVSDVHEAAYAERGLALTTVATILSRLEKAARRWLARRLPTCQQIAPVASRARDGQATLRQRVELRLHLTIC